MSVSPASAKYTETYSKQTTRRSRGDNNDMARDQQLQRLASLLEDCCGVKTKQEATDKECWENSNGNYYFGGNNPKTLTPLALGEQIIGDKSIVQVLYDEEPRILQDILTKLVSAGCDTSEGYLSTFYSEDTAGGVISGGLVADAKQKARGVSFGDESSPKADGGELSDSGNKDDVIDLSGETTPKSSNEEQAVVTGSGRDNSRKKRKIICDTEQPPAATTPKSIGVFPAVTASKPRPCDKGDTKLSSAAATKPTPKSNGNLPALPFAGSGDGDGFAAAVGGGGGASKPQPKQQQKASIAGASSGGVATSGAGTGAPKETEERAVDTAQPGDYGANSPRSQKMQVEQVKNATELKKDREEYTQSKEVFRHLTDSDLKSGKHHKVKIAHTSVKSIQAGVDSFNAKVSMNTNTEGDYARIAVEVGYNYFYSGPLDPSSVEQARNVLANFTPLVEEHWKYFEEGRKLQPLGKKVDGKAFEDAASE